MRELQHLLHPRYKRRTFSRTSARRHLMRSGRLGTGATVGAGQDGLDLAIGRVSQHPLVSVVTATHNRAERLSALLRRTSRADACRVEAFEVVIVDDASSDGTPTILDREVGRARSACASFDNDTCPGAGDRPEPRLAAGRRAADRVHGRRLRADGGLAGALLGCRAATRSDAIVSGRTLPNPAESDALGPYAKTVRIERPESALRDLQRRRIRARLLERSAVSTRPYPSPAGEDSDLGSRAVNAGGVSVLRAGRRWCTTRCSPVARSPLCATRCWRRTASQAYKRNPELRAHLPLGVFYDRSHTSAGAGGWWRVRLARRNPHAAGARGALPVERRGTRCRTSGGRWSTQAAFYPAVRRGADRGHRAGRGAQPHVHPLARSTVQCASAGPRRSATDRRAPIRMNDRTVTWMKE